MGRSAPFSAARSVDKNRVRAYGSRYGSAICSPEQEARLSQIADHHCSDVTQLVDNAARGVLEENERFRAAVREGIEAADRSVEKILRS